MIIIGRKNRKQRDKQYNDQMENGKLKSVTQRKHKEQRLNNKNSSGKWR